MLNGGWGTTTKGQHTAAHPHALAPRTLWTGPPLVGTRQRAYMEVQTEKGQQASGLQQQQGETDQARLEAMMTTVQTISASTTTEPYPRRLHQRRRMTLTS